MSHTPQVSRKVLRQRDLEEKTGLGRTSLFQIRKTDPDFPQSFSLGTLGGRAIGWFEADVDVWLEKQKQKSIAAK